MISKLNIKSLIAVSTLTVAGSACNDRNLDFTSFFNANSSNGRTTTSTVAPTGGPSTVSFAAAYPSHGSNWNDFVKNDGASVNSGSDTACDGTEALRSACVHGGEIKKLSVPSASSCAGLTATDLLGAFDWTCVASGGSVNFYSSLKSTKSVANLLNSSGWLPNQVILSYLGTEAVRSTLSTWWTNPVAVLPDNSGASVPTSLDAPSTLYVASASHATPGYNINADKASIVLLDGVTLLSTGAQSCDSEDGTTVNGDPYGTGEIDTYAVACEISVGSQKFTSIEGVPGTSILDGGQRTLTGVYFGTSPFSSIRGVTLSNQGTAVKYSLGSDAGLIFGATIRQSQADGIIVRSNGNSFSFMHSLLNSSSGFIFTTDVSYNSFTDSDISLNSMGVFAMANADHNTFARTVLNGNSGHGVYFPNGATYNTFNQMLVTGNQQQGIATIGSYNQFIGVDASNNGMGIHAGGAGGHNLISNSTIYRSSNVGVWSEGNNDSFSNVVASNSSNHGFMINGSNDTFDTITADHDNDGILDTGTNASMNKISASYNGGSPIAILQGNLTLTNATLNHNSNALLITNATTVSLTDVSANYNQGTAAIIIDQGTPSFTRVTASHNNNYGIILASTNGDMINVTASNNGQTGILSPNASSPVTYSNVVTNSNGTWGMQIGGGNISFSNVSATGNSVDGIQVSSGEPCTFNNVNANSNGNNGIALFSSGAGTGGSTFNNVTADNNTQIGIITVRGGNSFTNVKAGGNGQHGLAIYESGPTAPNVIKGLNVNGNGQDGIFTTSISGDRLSNIVASNNGNIGAHLSVQGSTIDGLTLTNNSSHGLYLLPGSGATISRVTSVNNGGDGVRDSSVSNSFYSNILAANNAGHGITLASYDYTDSGSSYDSSGSTLSQVVTANNVGDGIHIAGPTDSNDPTRFSAVKLTGFINVNANGGTACNNVSQNPVQGIADAACANADLSNATLLNRSIASPFVGQISATDTANTTNINGSSAVSDIKDWTHFSNAYRTWGMTGPSFPNVSDQGRCTSGNCQIWDYTLTASGTGVRNISGDGSSSNAAFSATHACPSQVNGDQTLTSYDGSITYLKNAIEISGDSIGNDNGLCETGEACIYLPNIGSYQGEGTLSTCVFSANSGAVTGVSMYGYPTNGL